MNEINFEEREIKEYESILQPKLLLIAEKPLSKDKKEIFDSPLGAEYLDTVFKTEYKAISTHVTYIESETVHFARFMLFNIFARYVWKKSFNIKTLKIGFIGQSAFDAFCENVKDSTDSENLSLYVNTSLKVLRIYTSWLSQNTVDVPYEILPEAENFIGTELMESLDVLRDRVSVQSTNSLSAFTYCDTSSMISKLSIIADLFLEGSITYFRLDSKINEQLKKITYFKVFDTYTNKELIYCSEDEICKDDSIETKRALYKQIVNTLNTVPVYGDNILNFMSLFKDVTNANVLDETEISTKAIKRRGGKVINTITNEELPVYSPADYPFSKDYDTWYNNAFPTLELSANQLKYANYGQVKYEWIYDIEVFKEDWLVVAKTLDGKYKMICWNDADYLRDWVRDKILIGFNNAAFDNPVMKHMMAYPYLKTGACTVKQFANNLIEDHVGAFDENYDYEEDSPISGTGVPAFLSWDISFHIPFDIRRNSLKKLTMAVLKRKNYDSSVPFDIDRALTKSEKADVELYCEMDVDNTLALFNPDPQDEIKRQENPKHKMREYAKDAYLARWALINTYNMPAKRLINKDASFAGKLLCGEYSKPNLKNTYKEVDGKKEYYCIPEIAMKELAGTEVLDFYLKNQHNPYYIEEKFECCLGDPSDKGNLYQFGFGGIHQALLKYRGENLVNMDVASLYPSLLIEYGLMSRGAVKNPGSYEEVRNRRLKAKRERATILDLGLKRILNSAIGAMLSKFNPLYDTWANSSICVHGQLLLFILIKRLHSLGFTIVQSNTDGIMIDKREDIDYLPYCKEWEEQTRLTLEYDDIAIVQQNNVNNYYCEFVNGKVKSKGFYLSNEKFGKATSKILCNMVTNKPYFANIDPADFVIYKRHAVSEIYDASTNTKVEGRSLAFVIGNSTDPRTRAYYSRSKTPREVKCLDGNGSPILDIQIVDGKEVAVPRTEIVHTISKVTGFTDNMLLVDDVDTLKDEEINKNAYIALAKNLLDVPEDFGPFFDENYVRVEEPAMLQALNSFKDNTLESPLNRNVICQNFLFESDILSKEEQLEIIERNRNILYRVVWSGNKSFHCVVRLNKPVTVTQYKKIWHYLRYTYKFNGADEQSAVASKYTRVPGQMNEKTGEEQTLYCNDKNVLDADEIIAALPKTKDDPEHSDVSKYTGSITRDALLKHLAKLEWTEGSRYAAVQKLSPILISQVSLEELVKLIPIKLDKDHIQVIRGKYKYFDLHKEDICTSKQKYELNMLTDEERRAYLADAALKKSVAKAKKAAATQENNFFI